MSSSRFSLALACAAAALALCALAADWTLGKLVPQSEALAAGRLARLAQHREPDEIPIFGASKASADYVPSVLGPRFYNYGLASASINVTNVLLEMSLEAPSRQPVIIDLNQGAFNEIGDSRNYLLLADRSSVRAMMQRAGVWQWFYAIPGLRFFGSWDWFAKGLMTDRIALTKQMERGRELKLNEAPWSADHFSRLVARRSAEPFRWSIDPSQKAGLLQLINRAPQRKFVIVLSPLHKSFFVRASGEAEFRQELESMQQKAPNLTIIDMTRPDYPDSFFLDTGHLNQRGARQFSAELRRELERGGLLPPN